MSKKIYLHIGRHKTGTTSIQALLHSNANLLRKYGIYYPEIHANHSQIFYSMFCENPQNYHVNIKKGYLSTKTIEKFNKKNQELLEKNLHDPSIHTVIFSGEALSIFTKEELGNFHRWLKTFSEEITVIYCARNPIGWYNSFVQQCLKGRRDDIATICHNLPSKLHTKVKQCLTQYIDYFGKENLIVYDFDSHKDKLDEKFMTSCSIRPDVIAMLLKQNTPVLGESLSQEACLILDGLTT